MAVSVPASSRFRIHMPHWPQPLWHEPAGTVQSRMQELLARLDHPQQRMPLPVHVAGTNGKGSTIAFLRAFLQSAGLAVHAYTSPHLQYFEERIVIAGEQIRPTALHSVLERVRAAAGDDIAVKFFEGTTAAAFLVFAENPADATLIECGMGGRDDSTNQVAEPACCIITPISFDHTEYLGSTLADIALHKAGILKPGVPCIVGPQMPEALTVIEQEAARVGAPLLVFGKHWAAQIVMEDGESFLRYVDAHGEVILPAPALAGAHQAANAGMAIAALTVLDTLDVPGEAVAEGLQTAHWPARFERITQGMHAPNLPPGWELWVDGGHNPAGAEMAAHHIGAEWVDKPTYLIFGTTKGKALAPMLAPLAAVVKAALAVPVAAEPKCYGSAEIIAQAQEAGIAMQPMDSVAHAIAYLCEAGGEPGRILIFGSLYLRVEAIG
jgi:dihydrofolate synthase/folylpolyglutamate synthase